ncbi:zinc finger C3H1 domain-containing protein-like [Physella acuta]|uniref:zinc finger C3H1 domain-containing protein-like n=1 Tax=Physella acuta TaxID=109671 RepID=UPI0027DAE905|nr:zinc finger C3H1 domain-containing protein-like [Physella acuta]XP_059178695.1 zinc finger C3H1 domain-containing protein-like [Physella acuta]
MSVSGIKNNIKEEGELSDEDESEDNNSDGRNNSQHLGSYGSNTVAKRDFTPSKHQSSRYDGADSFSRSSDSGNKSLSKRRDKRRSDGEMIQRSHRYDSNLRYRDRPDSRQNVTSDTYTPSKIWANRRFRASSVRPLTPPRHSKPLVEKSMNSPIAQPYRSPAVESTAEEEDELKLLEARQELIRNQLKHLEEEEKACKIDEDINEKGSDLSPFVTTLSEERELENGDQPVTSTQAPSVIEVEDDKFTNIDDDLDELRRLALATSERHNRLVASEPQNLQQGAATGEVSVVIIPDVEPDQPKPPEIIMVELDDDEEEVDENRKTTTGTTKMKGKKVKEHPGLVKSTVISVERKNRESKKKKAESHKKGDSKSPKGSKSSSAKILSKEYERLLTLAKKDRDRAMEEFIKLLDKKVPKVTGTMKDFKIQKKIPILSNKVDIAKSQSVIKKLEPKSKKVQDKKSGQLHDNYDEVEMDIDSDAEKNGASLTLEKLQLGENFNQAMQPIVPYTPYFPVFPMPVLIQPPPPSIPPPPPPPPPPPLPPSNEKEIFSLESMAARNVAVDQRWVVRNPPLRIDPYPQFMNQGESSLQQNIEDPIAARLHQIREEQEQKRYESMSRHPTTFANSNYNSLAESKSFSDRFIFVEGDAAHLHLPPRPTVDYSSLDDFGESQENRRVFINQKNISPHRDVAYIQMDKEFDYLQRMSSSPASQVPRKYNSKFGDLRDQSPLNRTLPLSPSVRNRDNFSSHTESNHSDSEYPLPYSPVSSYRLGDEDSRRYRSPSPFRKSTFKDTRYLSDDESTGYRGLHESKSHTRAAVPYSPYQSRSSRDISNKLSYSPKQSLDSWARKYDQSPSPPGQFRRKSLSPSYEEHFPYEPSSKRAKYSSPPPYIPTSITPSVKQNQGHESRHTSDSDEDDNLLREKLLATVIDRRKSKLKDVSHHNMSPRLVPTEPYTSSVKTSPKVNQPLSLMSLSKGRLPEVDHLKLHELEVKQMLTPEGFPDTKNVVSDKLDTSPAAQLNSFGFDFLVTAKEESKEESIQARITPRSKLQETSHRSLSNLSHVLIKPEALQALHVITKAQKSVSVLSPNIAKRLGPQLKTEAIPDEVVSASFNSTSDSEPLREVISSTVELNERPVTEKSHMVQRTASSVSLRLGPPKEIHKTDTESVLPASDRDYPSHTKLQSSSSQPVISSQTASSSVKHPTPSSDNNQKVSQASPESSIKSSTAVSQSLSTATVSKLAHSPVSSSVASSSTGPAHQSEQAKSISTQLDFSNSSTYNPPLTTSASTLGKRQYKMSQSLPVHPQVLVPLGSSGSEDEEQADILEQEKIIFLKAQEHLKKATGNQSKEIEFLQKLEMYLSLYKQNISNDQAKVNQLVKKAMKSVKAKKQAELKRDKLKAQIASLTEQMKVADRIAQSHKMQKENTEKEAQSLLDKLVKKKVILADKEKSVIAFGRKLFGPAYLPRSVKPTVRNVPQDPVATKTLTRAQYIALEKQKLIEKEKEIAERLKKLKETKRTEKRSEPLARNLTVIKHNELKIKQKSQDVIRIDQNVNPDLVLQRRRKSLLDINPCTTPNIPMTRHSRLKSSSYLGKENKMDEGVKDVENIKSGSATENLVDSWGHKFAFKMPSGMQLKYLSKLQDEKVEKHLRSPDAMSCIQNLHHYTSLSSPQQKLPSQLTIQEVKDKKVPKQSAKLAYTSALLMFRSYRLSSFFRTKENLGFQSTTYSHKINPHCVFCPYDLQGTCHDDSCQQQHPKDYKLSDTELLEDIVSYCPKLAGAGDNASSEDIKSCVCSYVENVMTKHKGKMTVDELCLWLSAETSSALGKRHPYMISLEPRKWKPLSKEETGLSLYLDHKLNKKEIEGINTEKRQAADKDAIINEEDVRYFAAGSTELLSLEAGIMEDQTNTQLWQRLASRKLNDPNKSPKECLDQALNVLARGLEVNKSDPGLWHRYLMLYRRHPDVKDFLQYCQTALEYAPSYDLWFLYLSTLKTFTEKDEVCTQILENLAKAKPGNIADSALVQPSSGDLTDPSSTSNTPPLLQNNTTDVNTDVNTNINTVINNSHPSTMAGDSSDVNMSDDTQPTHVDLKSGKGQERGLINSGYCDTQMDGCDSNANIGRHTEGRASIKVRGQSTYKVTVQRSSHQVLEMVLIKAGLNLHAGKIKTALHFLQAVLGLKKTQVSDLKLAELLTPADLLTLWMVYIHVLEWHQLPAALYGIADQNPGKLLAKDKIVLPWSSQTPLQTSLDHLVSLHATAAKVWTGSERDPETTALYIQIIKSLVALYLSQGKAAEAVICCRDALATKELVDMWLTAAELYASFHDVQGVKQVFKEALSSNPYNSKLKYYENLFLLQQGENELALLNLEQFVISHFDAKSNSLHLCDPNILFCQLLKQDEGFNLQMAIIKEGIPSDLHKDIYLWLCYSLLMELEGETTETVEIYERSLTHAQSADDLVVVWRSYIGYMVRSGSCKDIRDVVCRSIISMPIKRQIPFTTSSASTWFDYEPSSQLVEVWLEVLPPQDRLDLMEMCLGFFPGNLQLLLRAINLCLEVNETRRAYSWCKMLAAQEDRPANLTFWKMAIALAQIEGTQREVEQMFICCVETMPLAVSGWKDFLLFEVSRENMGAVEKLLSHLQQLGLNIDGFVATISAP